MRPVFLLSRLTGILFALSGCTPGSVTPDTSVLYETDFRPGDDGWRVGFADYSPQHQDMALESAWTTLPQPLDTGRKAIRVSGVNRSDDVFMFLKKKLTGLRPNAEYRLLFEVELASAYATNSVGIGGSPGSSVFLKAGATATEPIPQLKDDFYALNVDKGNQSAGGRDAVVLGTIGAGDDVTDYKLITRTNADKPFVARTNSTGELWLLIGTDSGYEGQTTLYYSRIRVRTP